MPAKTIKEKKLAELNLCCYNQTKIDIISFIYHNFCTYQDQFNLWKINQILLY